MNPAADNQSQSRFLIGIDLGTTNSALSYIDTAQKKWAVHDLAIPQLVGPGEVESRLTLPSFHYEAAEGEFASGALRLPWSTDTDPKFAVGAFARDHGAAVPGRLISSAKSWLSHSGVDRTAALLPWHGSADVQRLSPVEVSARLLAHLRSAWDHQFPQNQMAALDVVLCVPASFDEVARELTVEAARRAGISRVVLLEEPQAAFYAWIASQCDAWEKRVKAGQNILVCDIGGGTTDFTLIQVRPASKGKVLFHRFAVGEHLILGGDNVDLAIAHHVEKKIDPFRRLDPRQWATLVRTCRQVKETLLGDESPPRTVVHLAAGGSKLIGGAIQVELARDEVQQLVLDGFLPNVALSDKPEARRSGFQEFSLPYAPDPAMTRYLAAFLTAHRAPGRPENQTSDDHDPARPDLVLFNGGLFESPVLRQRLLDVMGAWFKPLKGRAWKPTVLKNDRLDLAVARGAAYFGMVRRGLGVRITGGLAHSYYIGVEANSVENVDDDVAPRSGESLAVCLLPAGVEEGQTISLTDRSFNLLIRQPVEFPLYASSTRTTDKPGAVIVVDREQLSELPPIRTLLQSGKKSAAQSVSVQLHAKLTPIGTLEIWCSELQGDRQWRLQFDVRAATRSDAGRHDGTAETQGVVDDGIIEECSRRILATFSMRTGQPVERPESLVKKLEEAGGIGRHDWPATLMRAMWATLMEVEAGRKISETYEARWLNLAGFCLRPGYGLAADDWRVGQTWKLLPGGITFVKNELCRAEWWILWRRLAGGLNAGQQQTLAEPLVADWRTWFRKGGSNVRGRSALFQFGPHESAEVWRLLGSLELLSRPIKLELGDMLLERLAKENAANVCGAILFALGRIGARVPVYGPLNELLPPELIDPWITRLLPLLPRDPRTAFTLVQLTRRTGDRHRDVSNETREAVLAALSASAAPAHYRQLVEEGGRLESEEQRTVFGETLPRGLRIE